MKRIVQQIEARAEVLERGEFCQWLIDPDVKQDKFNFVPSMVFLVFGFKDILKLIHRKNPKTDLEKIISVHCSEDLDHWVWYLHDIDYLGFNVASWGNSVTDIFKCIWDDEHEPFRRVVYKSVHYAQRTNDPAIHLVIIEVLEAVFGAFIKHMKIPVKQKGEYNSLRYFGETHVDKEEGHTVNVDKAHGHDFVDDVKLTESQLAEAYEIVTGLFDEFDKIFANWAKRVRENKVISRNHARASRFPKGKGVNLQI